MSRILFVSDVHLSENSPKVTCLFLNFLKKEAIDCDQLYLLGDLFDIWIGDDPSNLLHKKIAQALKEIKAEKFFIPGNRDFLLGQRFALASGMTILPEEKVVTLYGQRILIMHGDTLFTKNKIYQYFRYNIRKKFVKKIFLMLPLFFRMYIVKLIRIISNNRLSRKCDHNLLTLTSENQKVIKELMLKHRVKILIHGHTHYPMMYHFDLDGHNLQHIVLGAWLNYGSIVQFNKKNGISSFNILR